MTNIPAYDQCEKSSCSRSTQNNKSVKNGTSTNKNVNNKVSNFQGIQEDIADVCVNDPDVFSNEPNTNANNQKERFVPKINDTNNFLTMIGLI